MFQSEFGMDVDLSDTEMSEESMARKIAEMKKQYDSEQEERNKNQSKRKKSKKEIELEIKNKQAEDLQKKIFVVSICHWQRCYILIWK